MTSWAVIVGINDYPQRTAQPPLHGAVADAADFADWALDPQGGAVDAERLFFWTHPAPANPSGRLAAYLANPTPWCDIDAGFTAPDFTIAPTYGTIVETALEAAAAAADEALAGDPGEPRRIFVFFAGHGVLTNPPDPAYEPQTCFLTGDFRPGGQTVRGLIPCEDLRRVLLQSFEQVFMFLDCCRVVTSSLNMPPPTILARRALANQQTVWGVGSAAQQNKIAFETDAPPPRGAFSSALLEGLRSLRDPETQELTVDSLRLFVRDNIGRFTAQGQRPSFKSLPDDPSPVVVVGPPLPTPPLLAPVRIRLRLSPPGTMVQLCDAEGNIVAGPLPVPADGATVNAPLGAFYSVDVVGSNLSIAFRHDNPGGYDADL